MKIMEATTAVVLGLLRQENQLHDVSGAETTSRSSDELAGPTTSKGGIISELVLSGHAATAGGGFGQDRHIS